MRVAADSRQGNDSTLKYKNADDFIQRKNLKVAQVVRGIIPKITIINKNNQYSIKGVGENRAKNDKLGPASPESPETVEGRNEFMAEQSTIVLASQETEMEALSGDEAVQGLVSPITEEMAISNENEVTIVVETPTTIEKMDVSNQTGNENIEKQKDTLEKVDQENTEDIEIDDIENQAKVDLNKAKAFYKTKNLDKTTKKKKKNNKNSENKNNGSTSENTSGMESS